jgi:uncharacterized membrane protein YhaH (DUF805 family)
MNGFQYFLKVLRNYANFEGRARRSEYWYYTLFYYLFSIPLSFIDMAMESEVGMLGLIFALGMIVPSIAVGVRRMHDTGRSGWYLLIPIYNLVLACTNGDTGTNEYGPDPKGDAIIDEIDAIGTTE